MGYRKPQVYELRAEGAQIVGSFVWHNIFHVRIDYGFAMNHTAPPDTELLSSDQ